jgi:glutamate synthase domain-containing protein 2
MVRLIFIWSAILSTLLIAALGLLVGPGAFWAFAITGPLVLLGLADMMQTKHSIKRNFPVIGHGRYLMEKLRPEIQQYYVESNTDGTPYNRNFRSVAYRRAKGQIETMPFGTQQKVYEPGTEWVAHSLDAKTAPHEEPKVLVGEETCEHPYLCSRLGVSAMSYGALSAPAILALNLGAKNGGFAVNTGEGGISPYHLEHGGDLIWQIGTGYFGCRADDGGFDAGKFKENAARPSVKMIEVKLSQGAKPAHGGILPAAKVTEEISQIRGVPQGEDVLSPPTHSAFSNPREMMEFIGRLRDICGKPIGFKLCIGRQEEFVGLVKAMVETGIVPDFISIDGGEGGTGAAPIEFSNSIGAPLRDGLAFAHSILLGAGVRSRTKLIASGKIITGYHMFRAMALGADICQSARGFMFALGCIQARRCNHNDCPVGVASQRPGLTRALVVNDKARRVEGLHRRTIHAFLEIVAAAGLESADEIEPRMIHKRIDERRVFTFDQVYAFLSDRDLVDGRAPELLEQMWLHSDTSCFGCRGETAHL